MCSSGVKLGSNPSRMLKSFTIPSCKVFNPSSKVITLILFVVGFLALASSLLKRLKLRFKLNPKPKGIVGDRKSKP
jgi:hypothetical protein